MFNRLALLPLLLFALLLSGCAGKMENNHFYRLQPVVKEQQNSFEGSLGLALVKVPGWMKRPKYSISDGGVQIIRKGGHFWAEPIRETVTATLARDLSLLLGGKSIEVGPWYKSQSPDVSINVELLNFSLAANRLTLDAQWSYCRKGKCGSVIHREFDMALSNKASVLDQVKGFSLLLAELAEAVKENLVR